MSAKAVTRSSMLYDSEGPSEAVRRWVCFIRKWLVPSNKEQQRCDLKEGSSQNINKRSVFQLGVRISAGDN